MTLEELKLAAKNLGYKLVKDRPYISMSPCICGNKAISYGSTFPSSTPYFHKCRKCGFKSKPAKTKYEARANWNECVEKDLEEQYRMVCQVCGCEFDKAHNWGHHGYAVCPLCARTMTDNDWDNLVETQKPIVREQIYEE